MKLAKAKLHFIGIGGIGMCGLAEVLHNMGARVTGSDLNENVNTAHLKEIGVKIFKGHRAEQVGDADVVVYSSAIHFGNPEIAEARSRDIPLIARAEALAEIMRLKRGIAVAGTHGKTTTTGMVASILLAAQSSPTIYIGGRFAAIKSSAQLGQGEWLVAEADESDGSFNRLSPELAIITNIDSDHLDYFKSFDNLINAFTEFAMRVPFYGACVVCGDDPHVREALANFAKRVYFYGFDPKNDFVLKGEKGHYEIFKFDRQKQAHSPWSTMEMKVPGKHNALNGAAAFITGWLAGCSLEVCKKGLLNFEGVDRRFQFKGEKNGIKIYDDYGHHPTEVSAVLAAFKEKYPDNRIVVYFQPHRFSRTQSCWNDFTHCFQQSDYLWVTDIYPAGEAPIAGIHAKKLVDDIKHPQKFYLAKGDGLALYIAKQLKKGDVFVTLGAGDGWKLGLDVLGQL
jgi:UDP-N-acetylmuramate--alanine ligase